MIVHVVQIIASNTHSNRLFFSIFRFDVLLKNNWDLFHHRQRLCVDDVLFNRFIYLCNESGIFLEMRLWRDFSFSRKTFLDKFSRSLKKSSIETTLCQLGSEFLRVYDGKFNYKRGHTVRSFLFFFDFREKSFVFLQFVIDFENKTWLLTIDRLKCNHWSLFSLSLRNEKFPLGVEYELNQAEPRSVVILQYKNLCTTVQV